MKHILVSETNIASSNIGSLLPDSLKQNIIRTKENVIYFDRDPKVMQAIKNSELVIVASSHKSEAGINTLTCHSPGNWDKAELGGAPNSLSIAPALYLREALLELQKQKGELGLTDYAVSMEVTHHGPTLNIPIIFVEVGSSEKQWKDMNACQAAASVILKLVSTKAEKVPVAVGFGGGHYAPTFTRRVLENKIAFGHICAKYAAGLIDDEMVLKAIKLTSPAPDFAVLEWKGLSGEQRQKLVEILEKNKIIWKKDKEVKGE